MTTTSYRAVQASKPGRLEVVERELTAPPPGGSGFVSRRVGSATRIPAR